VLSILTNENIANDAENMVYQGGDDCIALKPNSTDITIRNVTCYGGTGIAFGSIAQYEGVVRLDV
jgi:galacturan 1,4-alpha-galacturonidase